MVSSAARLVVVLIRLKIISNPILSVEIGDRVIFRGWMYLEGAKRPYGTVDFGSHKNMVCDISLFITLQELREKNIDIALEI